MIPELGHYALIMALLLAVLQLAIPLLGIYQREANLQHAARPLCYGQLIFILFSYLCLTYAFISNDFSVQYVANNSNSQLPWFYRLCAVWGGHEGSILLWVLILNIWSALLARTSVKWQAQEAAGVLAICAFISIGFLCFILFTSNPFLRFLPNIPIQGRDLNPLLQDPGFVIHPPMLYMGYVGFAICFAMALYALIIGRLTTTWAKWMQPWTLMAWCFLTFGITLGSWWAYRELGWGGWWGWDPVENASLLPWLVGTALVHSLLVSTKRQILKTWTVLLAILTFSLSLLGTFLVRSGILTSVHAFAVDPKRGAFILGFLLLVIGGSLTIFAWRGSKLKSGTPTQLGSKAGLLLLNNVLLLVIMLSILLGTLYPLFIDALGLGKLSVGAPYFNSVFFPLMLPLLFVMGLGPVVSWSGDSWLQIWRDNRWRLSICIALGLLPLIFYAPNVGSLAGIIIASWLLSACFTRDNRSRRHLLGMQLAHLGMAVFIIGVSCSSVYSVQRDLRMQVGDQVTIHDVNIKWQKSEKIVGPNYSGMRGEFVLIKDGKTQTHMYPEKRIYNASQIPLTDAAIDIGVWGDWYIALGTPLNDTAWSVRLYYKPFIRWIWAGGLLMLFGGLLSALRRHSQQLRNPQEAQGELA